MGIILTAARIPLAYLIATPTLLGINGVWWAISLSSVAKGIVLVVIYFYLQKRKKLYDMQEFDLDTEENFEESSPPLIES